MEIQCFKVFYDGELIAEVVDHGKGFMALVEDASEVNIVKTDQVSRNVSVHQQVEEVSGTFTGVKIGRLG